MTIRGALEGQVECDSVLIKELVLDNTTRSTQLAWMKFVSQSNYEESRKNAQGQAYFDMFSGSWNEFEQKRNNLLTNENFNYSDVQTRQLLISRVPEANVSAWRECVVSKLKLESLACWFERESAESALLYVFWKPGTNPAPLKNGKVTLTGAHDSKKRKVIPLDNFYNVQSLTVFRDQPNGDVTADVSGTLSGAGAVTGFASTASLTSPKKPTVLPFSKTVDAYGYIDMVFGPYDWDAEVSGKLAFQASSGRGGRFGFSLFWPPNNSANPGGGVNGGATATLVEFFTFDLKANRKERVWATVITEHADNNKLMLEGNITFK